ncbi:ABC-2 transporter permease [Clostridium sp. D2Q-14]|uniref:ABC-2 transporter permease n=1 Tax=Anaeromonas gelatinilytica TaxID=2683194 RepID=UPI00193B2DD2|nr:ABC-2 transporter permease [Anaeromonas gelatinilytica]MBS4534109.1 ABC-2 transporter permease [Anaeromonas gelatinilytica]
MSSLIIKDILLIKRTILLGFIYMIFLVFAFQSLGSDAFISAVVALTYILLMTTLAYEEMNHSDIILNSLPIKRSNIVFSKYILTFIYSIISLLIYFIVVFVISTLNINVNVHYMNIMEIVWTLFYISVFSGIYLPIFFKFGYVKSKIFNVIVYVFIFSGASVISNIFLEDSKYFSVNSILKFFQNHTEFQISICLIGITLAIISVSYLISLYFYKNREF